VRPSSAPASSDSLAASTSPDDKSGCVLVRSIWRADVTLDPWDPQHEISFQRVVAAAGVARELDLNTHPFAPIISSTWNNTAAAPRPECGPASWNVCWP
jgi:hypothetical protein